jgi:hypothetical protein
MEALAAFWANHPPPNMRGQPRETEDQNNR